MEKYKPKNGSHNHLLTNRSASEDKIKLYSKIKKPDFGLKNKSLKKPRVYFGRNSTLGSEENYIHSSNRLKKSKQPFIDKIRNLRQESDLVRMKSKILE
jgi:hypothetical protein